MKHEGIAEKCPKKSTPERDAFFVKMKLCCLLKRKLNRQVKLNANGNTTLFTGYPPGHRPYYTDGLFIAASTDTTKNANIGNGSINFNNEGYEHLPLNAQLFGLFRVLDVFLQVSYTGLFTARVTGLLFYHRKISA